MFKSYVKNRLIISNVINIQVLRVNIIINNFVFFYH
jgi:hypothetical protein